MDTELICVNIAVLAIAEDPLTADLATVKVVVDRLTAAGHRVVTREIVKDAEAAIRDQLAKWIADPSIDVVIATGGTESETAHAALAPLVTQTVPGFTDLFRWLAFQEIGPGAMLSNAEAVQCKATFVFVLPASAGAVGAAMDKLIVPQLDHRTKPRNLVMQMPRLRRSPPLAKIPARPVIPSIPPPPGIPAIPPPPVKTAIPEPIASEKTVSGSGIVPKRLPAAIEMPVKIEPLATVNAGAKLAAPAKVEAAGLEPPIAVDSPADPVLPATAEPPPEPDARPVRSRPISRNVRPPDDPPTRPIDVAKLERQLALSAADQDAPTRPIDLAGLLPRLPPGADEFLDDDEPVPQPLLLPDPAARSRPNGVPRDPSSTEPKLGVRATKPPPITALMRDSTPKPARGPSASSELTNVRASRTPPLATPAVAATVTPPPHVAARPPTPPPTPRPPPRVEPEPAIPRAAIADGRKPPPVRNDPSDELSSAAKPARGHPVTTKVRPAPRDRSMIIDELPRGEFRYPERRGNTKRVVLVLGVLVAAAAASFIAVVQLFPRGHESKTSTPPIAAREIERQPVVVPPMPLDGPAPASVAETGTPEIVIDTAELTPPDAAPAAPIESAATVHSGSADPIKRIAKAPAMPPTSHVENPTPPPETPIALKPLDTAPAAADCDEVSCVLDHYARPCCERYRPVETGFTPRSSVPDEITRPMVVAGIQKAKPVVIACGERIAAKGTVKLGITVAADGHVQEVSVKETPDPALGECVASALRKTTFGKSVNGGSFTYPFAF